MKKQMLLSLAVAFVTAMAILCGIVLCDSIKDTTITAEVTPYISITPPDMSAAWSINPSILNTITKDLIVNANADWKVGAKAPNGANMKAVGPSGINYTLAEIHPNIDHKCNSFQAFYDNKQLFPEKNHSWGKPAFSNHIPAAGLIR